MMDATEGNHQGDRAMLGRAKLDRKHQSLLRARPCSWMPRACRGLGPVHGHSTENLLDLAGQNVCYVNDILLTPYI